MFSHFCFFFKAYAQVWLKHQFKCEFRKMLQTHAKWITMGEPLLSCRVLALAVCLRRSGALFLLPIFFFHSSWKHMVTFGTGIPGGIWSHPFMHQIVTCCFERRTKIIHHVSHLFSSILEVEESQQVFGDKWTWARRLVLFSATTGTLTAGTSCWSCNCDRNSITVKVVLTDSCNRCSSQDTELMVTHSDLHLVNTHTLFWLRKGAVLNF